MRLALHFVIELRGRLGRRVQLLLSVDPQDPMGVLGCIDYYAIMAEQYGFVLQLVNEFEACNHPLALRPGTCFSSSLARFRLEEKAGRAGTSARNKEVGGGDDAAGEEVRGQRLRARLDTVVMIEWCT